MMIEYHGWIALATSQTDWSDGDFDAAFNKVEQVIETLNPENGHDPIFPEATVLPRVVYLKGVGVESEREIISAARDIAALFDRAHGEIVMFDEKTGREAKRVVIENGEFKTK